MSDPSPVNPASNAQARLQELARLLRSASHLDAGAQGELADLMDELALVLSATPAPSAEAAHLADSAAHMAQALHQRREAGFLASARRRLEESAVRAESGAPLATGIARRLLEALADLGI